MQRAEVLAVLGELQQAGCRTWLAGGWAVDALVGRQTRAHRDLDLAIDSRDEALAVQRLARLCYYLETDWRPVRLELVKPGYGWVDLHPVWFDDTGHGRQPDLDGGYFDYPLPAFTEGLLDGVRLPCLTRDQQLRFRRGYPQRSVDVHDVHLLDQLGNEHKRS